MSRFVAVIFIVLVTAVVYQVYGSPETATGSLTLAQPAPTIGDEAPSFTAESMNEGTFRLGKKGIYVLSFWSPLNKGSELSRPELGHLAREYEGSNVSFVSVYVNDAPEDAGEIPYTVIEDSSGVLASRYNIKRVPRLFLIRDGEIALTQSGYFPRTEEYPGNKELLGRELEKTLEEKNASPG